MDNESKFGGEFGQNLKKQQLFFGETVPKCHSQKVYLYLHCEPITFWGLISLPGFTLSLGCSEFQNKEIAI